MKEKVEAAKELGLLSKKLATIMLDVPVTFNAKDFTLDQPDVEKVTEIFNELEFRNLLTNFLKTFADENAQKVNSVENNTAEKSTTKKPAPIVEGQFDLLRLPEQEALQKHKLHLALKIF